MKYIQIKHNEENTKHLFTIIGFSLELPTLHCKEDNSFQEYKVKQNIYYEVGVGGRKKEIP